MRTEQFFTDMAACFAPSSAISDYGLRSKWRKVAYRSGDIRGTMLSAIGSARPENVSFDPKLEGWYKVYVAMPDTDSFELAIQLTGDEGFYKLSPLYAPGTYVTSIEETLWRCCDMTGKAITVSRQYMNEYVDRNGGICWLRFVPMEAEEVAEYEATWSRPETRRIYATDDIHNRLYEDDMSDPAAWDSVVLPYDHSDVEWLSMEDIAIFLMDNMPADKIDDFAFIRPGDWGVQKQLKKFDSMEVLTRLVKKGQEKGLKMSISLRMGAWGMGYPFDQTYFDNDFFLANPQLRCVTREGVPTVSLSYAFEEVQQYMIDRLVTLAGTGCEALALISHRGGPYMLFEKPVADRFMELYGEEPYTLPLDDPRLNALHCQIMTEFFRKLRAALDAAYPQRHVQIHLRTMGTVYDTRYYAMDCEQLAKEGLVDALVVYPQRYREKTNRVDFVDGRFDLEKHTELIYGINERPFIRDYDTPEPPKPYPDSQGVLQGPADLQTCCDEWMAIEKAYGTLVYMEIMPRVIMPEDMRSRALELYACGIERLALWDTYGRVPFNGMWALTRYLGHKDELANIPGPFFKKYRLQEVGGLDITRCHPCWGG